LVRHYVPQPVRGHDDKAVAAVQLEAAHLWLAGHKPVTS
jgi:hypothetical protein